MTTVTLATLLSAFYRAFGRQGPERNALREYLKGKTVLNAKTLKPMGKVENISEFVGGTGVYFGGPARGCDYRDTWVYLREISEDGEGRLLYNEET